MTNQKRGLTDLVSCLTTEIPGRQITNSGAKEKHQLKIKPRRAKQQTRNSGPNQL